MSHNIVGNISIIHYICISSLLFSIGLCGLLANRQNMIAILMAIELMLLAVNINLVSFSCYLKDTEGQVITIFILTVAAAEAAIGLAIIMHFFRAKGNIDVVNASEMRG
jgi:NADH-quinone oxidoreductase subunit K